MWSAILSFGGWVVFSMFLFFYVLSAIVEREFFAGQDPDNRRPDFASETLPTKDHLSKRMERLSRVASLGAPA